MGSLQGPVLCPSVRAKLAGFCSLPMIGPINHRCLRSEFWGLQVLTGGKAKARILSCQINARKCKTVHCSFSSSSNGNGSMAENFNEKDEDYVNSSVVEAVEVKSGIDGFIIKMRDGRHLRCVHNNPHGGHLPDYAPHPAIVLKMEDGTDLLLPIIVLEMPSVLLMAAVRNVPIARPTLYQVVKEMVYKMGYEVRLVRVTKRVHEAYFAQLYLTKVGNEEERMSFDLRPSDAINIAVRCKVNFVDLCTGNTISPAEYFTVICALADGKQIGYYQKKLLGIFLFSSSHCYGGKFHVILGGLLTCFRTCYPLLNPYTSWTWTIATILPIVKFIFFY